MAPLRAPSDNTPAGTPLGVAAARNLVAALAESIAVVRPGDDAFSALRRVAGLRIIECANADDGMGASLACGVRATADADGWVIALADMPWVAPATIAKVAQALAAGADIAAPVHAGRRGHPVGFARRHYAALSVLAGDAGARGIIESSTSCVALIDVDDSGILGDVDRPEDLQRTDRS